MGAVPNIFLQYSIIIDIQCMRYLSTCIQRLARAQGARGARRGKGRHQVSPSPIPVFLKHCHCMKFVMPLVVTGTLNMINMLVTWIVRLMNDIMIMVTMTMMMAPKLQTSDFEVQRWSCNDSGAIHFTGTRKYKYVIHLYWKIYQSCSFLVCILKR